MPSHSRSHTHGIPVSSKTDDANDGAEDDHNGDVDNNLENDYDADHGEKKQDRSSLVETILLLWRTIFFSFGK